MLLQQGTKHHCVDCTTGQTTQTLKYLFRVLQGELSLNLESGAEDALQDNRTKCYTIINAVVISDMCNTTLHYA